jgi:shikimate dehydrogenase
MQIGGGTRVYALLGDPVSHSLSPAMHNAAFQVLGIDAVYVPMRCSAPALGAVMESLVRQGGGGNLTIPHKEAAARLLGDALPDGTCNTFWGRDGKIEGAETDSAGILAALERLAAPSGDWAIIGTGGSARAALIAARTAGVGIAVRSRTPGRAAEFRAAARSMGVGLADPGDCRVVINCTPLGLDPGDPDPVTAGEVPRAEVALDLVYRRGETVWVRAMRAAGRRAADGREVLVEQGALSFERWCAGTTAPREVMRAAVRAGLA